MTASGAAIRSEKQLEQAVKSAREQWDKVRTKGIKNRDMIESLKALECRHLCFTHLVYLETALDAIKSGAGSRGSALVLSNSGRQLHPCLTEEWNYIPEEPVYQDKVFETITSCTGKSISKWAPRHKIPKSDAWFESVLQEFQKGEIYF